MVGIRPIDSSGADLPYLERRGKRDKKTGASAYPPAPSAQYAKAAGRSHIYLDHCLVRPGIAPAGVVFARDIGGGIWGYGLLDCSVNTGAITLMKSTSSLEQAIAPLKKQGSMKEAFVFVSATQILSYYAASQPQPL